MNYYQELIKNLNRISWDEDVVVIVENALKLLGETTFNTMMGWADQYYTYHNFFVFFHKSFRTIELCEDVYRVEHKNKLIAYGSAVQGLWYGMIMNEKINQFLYMEFYRLLRDQFPKESIELKKIRYID